MNNNYLKGFTVLEALISLILMSIIITLTYSIYNLIEKQMMLFQTEHDSILQYNVFNTTFKNDIYKAIDVMIVDNQIGLKYYDDTNVTYHLANDHILRETIVKTDTFKLPVSDYSFTQEQMVNETYNKLNISTRILSEPLETSYYVKTNRAQSINTIYFNEN